MKKIFLSFNLLFSNSLLVSLFNVLREFLLLFLFPPSLLSFFYSSRLLNNLILGFLGGGIFNVFVCRAKIEKNKVELESLFFNFNLLFFFSFFSLFILKSFFSSLFLSFFLLELIITYFLFLFLWFRVYFMAQNDYLSLRRVELFIATVRLIGVFFLFFPPRGLFFFWLFQYFALEGGIIFLMRKFSFLKFSYRVVIFKFLSKYKDYFFNQFLSLLANSLFIFLLKQENLIVYYYWGNKFLKWGNLYFKDWGRIILSEISEKKLLLLNKLNKIILKRIVLVILVWFFLALVIKNWRGEYYFLFWLSFLPAIPGRYYYQIVSQYFYYFQKESLLFKIGIIQEILVIIFCFLSVFYRGMIYFMPFLVSLLSLFVVIILSFLSERAFQSDMFEETYHI